MQLLPVFLPVAVPVFRQPSKYLTVHRKVIVKKERSDGMQDLLPGVITHRCHHIDPECTAELVLKIPSDGFLAGFRDIASVQGIQMQAASCRMYVAPLRMGVKKLYRYIFAPVADYGIVFRQQRQVLLHYSPDIRPFVHPDLVAPA